MPGYAGHTTHLLRVSALIMPLTPTRQFHDACAELGVAFDAGDIERLEGYLDALLEANKSFNLTSITEPDEAWMRHVFDSLTLMPFLADLQRGARVADVGSGGGAPGVPLAIAMPGLRLTLIESTGKKARFLETTAERLALTNVDVVNDRAESVGQDPAHRERYSAVLARALGRVVVAAELTVPLAAPGGRVLLIKGAKAEEEIEEAAAALDALRAEVSALERTPTGVIVALEKTGPAPRKYPRRPGEPKRAPIR